MPDSSDQDATASLFPNVFSDSTRTHSFSPGTLRMIASSGRTTLLPGVVDCLDTLAAADCAVALVTNKLQSAATIVLDHFELSDRFTIILGDQEGLSDLAPKPEPDMLLHALSHVGVEPAHAVMVGDSEADMASARAAGVFSVAVRGGYCNGPLEDLEPDVVIDSLYGFAEAVEAWRRHG